MLILAAWLTSSITCLHLAGLKAILAHNTSRKKERKARGWLFLKSARYTVRLHHASWAIQILVMHIVKLNSHSKTFFSLNFFFLQTHKDQNPSQGSVRNSSVFVNLFPSGNTFDWLDGALRFSEEDNEVPSNQTGMKAES